MGASAGDNPHPAKAAPPVQRAHKKECPSSAGLGGVIAGRTPALVPNTIRQDRAYGRQAAD
jgi:hypothetical protein